MLIRIVVDDVTGPEVVALLTAHRQSMFLHSPPESVHALDLAGLRGRDVTMWSAWSGRELLGCGALREIDPAHGEVKSMRTADAHLRKGVGRAILQRIIDEARTRPYARLSLETGAAAVFEPARRLYEAFGFVVCGPFGEYVEDPHSVFMMRPA